MKAFLLAAGKGTRLRPVTNEIPKCLVPVNKKPLIDYWFDLFQKHGITEVLVNCHHLHSKVKDYLKNQKRKLIKINIVHEKRLLGSGGTIKANSEFVEGDESFFICYADNLTAANLNDMQKTHKSHSKTLTLGVFSTDNPGSCGIVEVDKNNIVKSFIEKPKNPKTNLAAAGVYIARKNIFDYFPDKKIFDLGHDVFPKMIDDMVAYKINEYFLDIGTMENYKKANEEFRG